MHILIFFVLATGTCLAYYGGVYDARSLTVRDDLPNEKGGVLVECPVCSVPEGIPSIEECPITVGNKQYKLCLWGITNNTVCGNLTDCLKGPGERCTEKMQHDTYGQKCATGFYCHGYLGQCIGGSYPTSSLDIMNKINRNRWYRLRTIA